MPIPLAALATTLEIFGSIGPSIAKWAKNRKDQKQSIEQRMEHAEALLEELSKGFSGLDASLTAIQQALLAAEAERQKLASRTRALTVATALACTGAAIAIVLPLILQK